MARTAPTIAAIQTEYAGCHFRSRLEARWAVFFDTLGVDWRYEAEGYVLFDGSRYLPDFWLPRLGAYYEVKGAEPTVGEMAKLLAFESALGYATKIFVAVGDIPRPERKKSGLCIRTMGPVRSKGAAWKTCRRCGLVSIPLPDDVLHDFTAEAPAMLDAYRAARSARFDRRG